MAGPGNILLRFGSFLLKLYRVARAVIFNLLFLFLLLLLISPWLPQPQLPVPSQTALLLNPAGVLVEQKSTLTPANQLFSEATGANDSGEVLLQDMLDAIALAANDERISAMVIVTDWFQGGGFSQLRDIGNAIQKFRGSGKKVYAWGGSFTQAQYYLASQADEIILNPLGAVELEGFGAWQLYYHEALEKLGVKAHVFRVGDFKAAVEPYERNDMSPEANANYSQLLNELWTLYLNDISSRRQISANLITDYINHMDVHLAEHNGDSAVLAQDLGLVDRISARPQSVSYLREAIGADGDSFRNIGFETYLARARITNAPTNTTNQIGVIVASGEIQDGDAPPGTVGSDTMLSLIQEARNNDRIKALVLRIDSPGGGVFASEVIREELLAFKATKRPLVISMGSVAASGGYWISTPADEIWAGAATITGSIGIYGVALTFEDSFAKLGITADGVGTTELSGTDAIGRPLSDLVINSQQHVIENGYERFLGLVGDSRRMTRDEVDVVAQGQIWTGQTALALNLVDHLGNLEEAVAAAARLANIENYQTFLLETQLSPFQQLVREVLNNTGIKALLTGMQETLLPGASSELLLLKDMRTRLASLLRYNDPRESYVHCMECVSLELW